MQDIRKPLTPLIAATLAYTRYMSALIYLHPRFSFRVTTRDALALFIQQGQLTLSILIFRHTGKSSLLAISRCFMTVRLPRAACELRRMRA